jgi:alkaline phosphatase D
VIHVGDYIYDFIDAQERVRIPQPEPVEPVTLAEWRDRYRLYLLDPDQREVRRRKPWIQMWDNHDLNGGHKATCARAYYDFSPVRQQADSMRIWRKVSYGPMVDVIVLDDWQYAGRDTFPDGGEKMIPDDQYSWLATQLDSSRAVWKVIAVSKLFNFWELGGFASLVPGGFNNSWQGYPESRDSVLHLLSSHHVKNPVIVSGDLHMNIVSDLAINPFDSLQYDSATGNGGLGVEVNGISVTRGNFDESGVHQDLGPSLYEASLGMNHQQRYLNFFDNGYAILTFNNDSMIARMQICPILFVTDSQRTDAVLIDRVNDNHWLRQAVPNGISSTAEDLHFSVYPNPSADGQWRIRADASLIGAAIEVSSTDGRIVYSGSIAGANTLIKVKGDSGLYFLKVSDASGSSVRKLVKM